MNTPSRLTTPIETENLGKCYGDVRAVEGLSLRVAEGEIYAFLGLNGAGKTTTIRMLLGMIRPTSGYATVLQTRVRLGRKEPWASVGYMVEDPHAYPELTVYENLEVTRRLHPGTSPKAVGQIIDRLNLAAYANRRAGTLSHGTHALGIGKSSLHDRGCSSWTSLPTGGPSRSSRSAASLELTSGHGKGFHGEPHPG
jgi:ABC-2 type transport system ATP-binding protein